MEPKKIKKLVLRKETISNLSGSEQGRIKGGRDCDPYVLALVSADSPLACILTGYSDDGGNGGTGINDCPNHSQVDSGCDAETCGWAETCNGR